MEDWCIVRTTKPQSQFIHNPRSDDFARLVSTKTFTQDNPSCFPKFSIRTISFYHFVSCLDFSVVKYLCTNIAWWLRPTVRRRVTVRGQAQSLMIIIHYRESGFTHTRLTISGNNLLMERIPSQGILSLLVRPHQHKGSPQHVPRTFFSTD